MGSERFSEERKKFPPLRKISTIAARLDSASTQPATSSIQTVRMQGRRPQPAERILKSPHCVLPGLLRLVTVKIVVDSPGLSPLLLLGGSSSSDTSVDSLRGRKVALLLPWEVVVVVAAVLLVTAIASKDVFFLEGVVGDEEGDRGGEGLQQG